MNLNQVTAPSTDVARSIDFYRRLGLRLIVDALPNYALFEHPDGDSTFSLERVEQAPGGHGVVVYIECEDLEQSVADLKKAGVRFEFGPQGGAVAVAQGAAKGSRWQFRLPVSSREESQEPALACGRVTRARGEEFLGLRTSACPRQRL